MDTFLTSQNLNANYKFVVNRVRQDTGVDLNKYPGMDRQFQKMATLISNKVDKNSALSFLNQKLITDASQFFSTQISRKKQLQPNQQPPGPPTATNEVFNPNLGFSMLKKNGDITADYSDIVVKRQAEEEKKPVYDMPVSINARDEPKLTTDNMSKALQNILLERGQVNITSGLGGNGDNVPKIQPFSIADDISSMLSNEVGVDLPLYHNMKDFQDPDNQLNSQTNLMKRVEEAEGQRLMSNPVNVAGKPGNVSGSNDIFSRNNTDAETLFMSQVKDPADLYKIASNGTKSLINRMSAGGISGNDVQAIQPLTDNTLIEKLLSFQRELQPKYMERVNYIIVNSVDRDWFNNSSESRYNFKVNFKPHSTYQGAGIIDLYKNVTSIELVNAIIPQDCVNVPFDSRVYIDILNFPYLLLQVPEFSDVFRGTNSSNDRAFSVLMFDKQHDSSVLSTDFISGASTSIVNSTPTTQFYREYRKTFYKYTPAYFEKKVFDNMPLASLSHLTLVLNTPAGENLNTLSDVLTIASVSQSSNLATLAATLEYDTATSYPNDSTHGARNYVRINTTTAFSSKLFKLGDLIKIEGYSTTGSGTDNTQFTTFVNREEGHYILNMDITNISLSNGNQNQGYISNLYIAPPGSLNGTLTGLTSSSYYINGGQIDFGGYTSGNAKLINTALQTHYLFKITTREPDVKFQSKPMNI